MQIIYVKGCRQRGCVPYQINLISKIATALNGRTCSYGLHYLHLLHGDHRFVLCGRSLSKSLDTPQLGSCSFCLPSGCGRVLVGT